MNDLPYSHSPKSMVVGCAVYRTKILNNLPCENGLSETLSPATLITGTPPPRYIETTKLNLTKQFYIPYKKIHLLKNIWTIAHQPLKKLFCAQ